MSLLRALLGDFYAVTETRYVGHLRRANSTSKALNMTSADCHGPLPCRNPYQKVRHPNRKCPVSVAIWIFPIAFVMSICHDVLLPWRRSHGSRGPNVLLVIQTNLQRAKSLIGSDVYGSTSLLSQEDTHTSYNILKSRCPVA